MVNALENSSTFIMSCYLMARWLYMQESFEFCITIAQLSNSTWWSQCLHHAHKNQAAQPGGLLEYQYTWYWLNILLYLKFQATFLSTLSWLKVGYFISIFQLILTIKYCVPKVKWSTYQYTWNPWMGVNTKKNLVNFQTIVCTESWYKHNIHLFPKSQS